MGLCSRHIQCHCYHNLTSMDNWMRVTIQELCICNGMDTQLQPFAYGCNEEIIIINQFYTDAAAAEDTFNSR